jgi:hypothetical protein
VICALECLGFIWFVSLRTLPCIVGDFCSKLSRIYPLFEFGLLNSRQTVADEWNTKRACFKSVVSWGISNLDQMMLYVHDHDSRLELLEFLHNSCRSAVLYYPTTGLNMDHVYPADERSNWELQYCILTNAAFYLLLNSRHICLFSILCKKLSLSAFVTIRSLFHLVIFGLFLKLPIFRNILFG